MSAMLLVPGHKYPKAGICIRGEGGLGWVEVEVGRMLFEEEGVERGLEFAGKTGWMKRNRTTGIGRGRKEGLKRSTI